MRRYLSSEDTQSHFVASCEDVEVMLVYKSYGPEGLPCHQILKK